MAAPTPGARSAPSGKELQDGYQTLIAFKLHPDIAFHEITVQPPGIEGGDPKESTTMHNLRWKSKSPRRLKDMTNANATVGYDPALYTSILAQINKPDTVTIHFPDVSSLAFYGYLKNFMPSELKDGEKPTAKIEVVVTNMDPATCVEEDPVFTPGPGTGPC
jgi:hypothetical protein